jgi:hypothetical protein
VREREKYKLILKREADGKIVLKGEGSIKPRVRRRQTKAKRTNDNGQGLMTKFSHCDLLISSDVRLRRNLSRARN